MKKRSRDADHILFGEFIIRHAMYEAIWISSHFDSAVHCINVSAVFQETT